MHCSVLERSGDYSQARRHYEHALELSQRGLGQDHAMTATLLMYVAVARARDGEYAQARQMLERALAIQEKILDRPNDTMCVGFEALASVLDVIGETAQALAVADRSVRAWEGMFGDEHPSLAKALELSGRLHMAAGDYDRARQLLDRALDMRERVFAPNHPEVAASLVSVAALRRLNNEASTALDMSLRAQASMREHLQRTARSLSEREALRYEAIRSSGLDLAFTVLAGTRLPATATSRAWDELIRSRALVLDELAERHRTVLDAGVAEVGPLVGSLQSARDRFARLLVAGPQDKNPRPYPERLAEAQREVERAERALADKSETFRRQREQGTKGLAQVAGSLPSGSALVAYVQYNRVSQPAQKRASRMAPVPSYMALVATSSGAGPRAVPLGEVRNINGLVHRWREEAAAAPADLAAVDRYRDAGDALRRAIWDPLVGHMGGSRAVFVVPDGELHSVAFHTLPTEEQRYLVESGPRIHYLSAERDLLPGASAPRVSGGLLVVGGPDYEADPDLLVAAVQELPADASGTARSDETAPIYRGPTSSCTDFRSLRFEPLPSSLAEAAEVESLWAKHQPRAGATVKLTGSRAGEGAFKRMAPGRQVIHVATHGFFVEDQCVSALAKSRTEWSRGTLADLSGDNPLLLSGLAFAGANRRDQPIAGKERDDGILTAEEIASLDLRGAEWVVLSACETGVGRVQTGEGVLGLRRAFEVAGTGTLIMSLWPVADNDARQWMRNLYQGRLSKLSTADAVKAASLQVIEARRQAGITTHPFFWGAFVAAGDPS